MPIYFPVSLIYSKKNFYILMFCLLLVSFCLFIFVCLFGGGGGNRWGMWITQIEQIVGSSSVWMLSDSFIITHVLLEHWLSHLF